MSNQISYIFTPGLSSIIFLPANENSRFYEATLRTGLSGAVSLSACYDKYGIVWQWSTFETGNSALPGTSFFSGLCALSSIALQTSIPLPSSWSTTQCKLSDGTTSFGPYPKKWINEGSLSATLFNKFNQCSATFIQWTLSSERWSEPYVQVIPLSVSESFTYELQLNGDGLESPTVSRSEDTNLTINAKLTATCFLSANAWTYPTIDETFAFTSVVPPLIKLYTSNRFMLTGTPVVFENLITKSERVNRLDIDFDDGLVVILTGSQITAPYFSQIYDIVGFKTLKLTAYTYTSPTPIVATFPNIVQIVSEYDQVSPTEYRSSLEPISLPWKTAPIVGFNDWVVEDNINSCFKKFYENLEYLETRGRFYPAIFSDYFGYLGATPTPTNTLTACEIWTWNDLDPFTSTLPYTVTWGQTFSAQNTVESGPLFNCSTWRIQECGNVGSNPRCEGIGDQAANTCLYWNWRDRDNRFGPIEEVTWSQTVSGGRYQKFWYFEPCPNSLIVPCNEGVWNVNIPKLDTYYDPIRTLRIQSRCVYSGLVSKNNNLFLTKKTEINLLSSDYTATPYNSRLTIDDIQRFVDIKSVCLDSNNRIYVLDKTLSQIAAYTYDKNNPLVPLDLYVTWGGYGSATSKTKFTDPNDLHIDKLDNVWVCDTGNSCIKHYSNSGTWLNTITDDDLKLNPPLSLCTDSQQNIHVLTSKEVRVYAYTGIFLYSYDYKQYATAEPRKIAASFNKEVIYVAFATQVIKFFRNGVFAGYILSNKAGVNNITDLYHDEYRNLLITTDDKVLKYADIMTLRRIKGILPPTYWSLEDLYIHKEEYIQNWVYTKSFERLWDNIELFRSTLLFTGNGCKKYTPPIYGKEKMTIGQNEIVTASTINRVLGYLWNNFNTLINYFDPSCIDILQE